jgi:tagatose-1,6-bisphosphate aldolase
MTDLTKSQKKYFRQLAGQCYEKEMSLVLETLYEDFQQWKKSEIDPWDLNEKIHEYHDKTARDLWKIYVQMNDPSFAVSIALAKGIIEIGDIREDCRDLVKMRDPSEWR